MATRAKSTSKSKSAEAVDEPIVLDGDEDANEVVEDGEEDGEEDEEEGEYEVEAIVAHKQLNGKYDYLVSWKGYGPEHNTWEPEAHVSHARDIVQRYWDSQPKNAPVIQRSKRGRPSSSSSPAVTSQKPTKTPRANGNGKGTAKSKKKAISPDAEDELLAFETTHMDSLAKYEDVPDWEDLVESIETIERNSNNELMVFMTMTGGEKTGQPTEVAYKRCPQKILKFYEAHLKWKMTE